MGEKIDETRNNTNDKVNCLTKHSTKQPPQANECRKDMDLKVSKKKKSVSDTLFGQQFTTAYRLYSNVHLEEKNTSSTTLSCWMFCSKDKRVYHLDIHSFGTVPV